MANKVQIRTVENMPGYMEFDYKNTSIGKRVRRKIKATEYQAKLLNNLLETVLADNMDKADTIQLIRTNSFYAPISDYLEEAINIVYFNYLEDVPVNVIERETAKTDLLSRYMPLNYGANYCLLGKAGVGKSTLIKKLSCFWNNKEISFPFTDTSRTSTFPADYCFVPKESGYKFLVLFSADSIIDLHLNECIERAINKMIDLRLVHQDNVTNEMDEVFEAFVSDPTQAFDIRYSLGKYIKTTSPAYNKPENQELVHFWLDLYHQLENIIGYISNSAVEQKNEALYYQLLYSDAIKKKNSDDIYNSYKNIYDHIYFKVMSVKETVVKEVKTNPITKNCESDLESVVAPFFYCELDNEDSDAFNEFIQIFTTKKAKFWGRSLFNLVSHLRIEIPLNPAVKLPQKGFSFVIQDTIGIAHSNDGNGGFENSTILKTDNLDAVVLVDDSRLNGDNNITAILQHLVARMDIQKIYFAFSFFDDLKKEDFDEDDDINEQRMNYLISTESNSIKNILQNDSQSTILIRRLRSRETCFLSGLMDENDYSSVQNLITILISQKISENNDYNVYKPDPKKAFIEYDYRKIPLLYDQAIKNYCAQQNSIYIEQPPHYKTTEALTRRLANGITYFSGARVLRPVDDLYHQLITALSNYIENPQLINVKSIGNDENSDKIILQVKSLITEYLRTEINAKFLNNKAIAKWDRLYQLTGTGSDRIRREGILKEENEIAPDVSFYLSSTVQEHIIDTIQTAFENAIKQIETQYNL